MGWSCCFFGWLFFSECDGVESVEFDVDELVDGALDFFGALVADGGSGGWFSAVADFAEMLVGVLQSVSCRSSRKLSGLILRAWEVLGGGLFRWWAGRRYPVLLMSLVVRIRRVLVGL